MRTLPLCYVQFSVSTVHELSCRDEKNSWLSRDSNPGLLGGKHECYICAMQHPTYNMSLFSFSPRPASLLTKKHAVILKQRFLWHFCRTHLGSPMDKKIRSRIRFGFLSKSWNNFFVQKMTNDLLRLQRRSGFKLLGSTYHWSKNNQQFSEELFLVCGWCWDQTHLLLKEWIEQML